MTEIVVHTDVAMEHDRATRQLDVRWAARSQPAALQPRRHGAGRAEYPIRPRGPRSTRLGVSAWSPSHPWCPAGAAGAGRLLKELADRSTPLVLTQDGRPACVVISPAQYDRWRERQDFMESVARGLADVDAGLSIDDEELDAELDAELGSAQD